MHSDEQHSAAARPAGEDVRVDGRRQARGGRGKHPEGAPAEPQHSLRRARLTIRRQVSVHVPGIRLNGVNKLCFLAQLGTANRSKRPRIGRSTVEREKQWKCEQFESSCSTKRGRHRGGRSAAAADGPARRLPVTLRTIMREDRAQAFAERIVENCDANTGKDDRVAADDGPNGAYNSAAQNCIRIPNSRPQTNQFPPA